MQKQKFIKFGKPYIDKNETRSINNVLKSRWIGTGPIVEKFEKQFSKYKNSKYALSLNSCTAALHLSILSLGLKKDDEIITSPLTFCSTINSILMSNCKPILVDIRKDNFNINDELIEKKITRKTKAILVVHFAGMPCSMDEIRKIAKKYNLKIIEDCAHAIETEYKNQKVGTFGETGNFSFYANKNITTGEGGMLICQKKKISDFVKIVRLHGMSKDAWKRYLPDIVNPKNRNFHYDVKYTGFKYNMTDLQAALGNSQLKKINFMWMKRKKLYENYLEKLKDLPVFFQKSPFKDFKHGYHLFVFILDKKKTKKNRDNLMRYLNKKGIGTAIHYRSVTEMSHYKKTLNWKNKDCPISYYVGSNTISLPLYPGLKNSEQNYIISEIKKFFNV
jgi:dTDP-4-amino-4,6-dideoxygalactose transaminase